jgi:hypothetical protein
VGDRFDMQLYDDVTEDMTLGGWVDVTAGTAEGDLRDIEERM